MKKLLFAALLALTATAANARELPACDTPEVEAVMVRVVNPEKLFLTEPYQTDRTDKRWCRSAVLARHGRGQLDLIYTIEWTNEAEGRWWLEIKSATNFACPGFWEVQEKTLAEFYRECNRKRFQ